MATSKDKNYNSKDNKNLALGVGIAATVITVGTIGAILLLKNVSGTGGGGSRQGIATIELTAASPTEPAGGNDTLTAVASDVNGNPVPNATLTLYEVNTNSVVTTETTDPSGTATFSITIPSSATAGSTYSYYVSG